MQLDEEDIPLPQGQAPGELWAEDQFDDELMRALAERPLQGPQRQAERPQ